MRKSHRDGESSKQSCKNPYHRFAEGGEVPGTDQNDSNLGRSKKAPSAAENTYRGGANAKRLNTNVSGDQNMGRTTKVKSIAEGMYQGKANAKRFAMGGMSGTVSGGGWGTMPGNGQQPQQADMGQAAQQQPPQQPMPTPPPFGMVGMRRMPQIGYGRPGDPSMYNGGGMRRVNSTYMPQPQAASPQPQQTQQPQIQSAKCGKLIKNFHHRSPKR